MARRSLENMRVIITGASSGIGEELAKQLAEEKCRLVLNARRCERLAKLVDSLPNTECVAVVGDICEQATRTKVIERCVSQFGGIDILVNNAGVGAIGPFKDSDPQTLRKVMEVNFFAPAELTRLAIPHMTPESQPVVVNIGSVIGHRAIPMKSEYCASKFALHGWSDALRTELVKQNIDVLLVSPSTTDSEFFDSVIAGSSGKNRKLRTAKSSGYVARKTVRAIKMGKHEIILTFSGRSLVWLDRLFPWLAHKIVTRFGQ